VSQITAITEQKSNEKRVSSKKDRRYNIFLDEKYAFSVGEENMLKHKFEIGRKLTGEEVEKTKIGEAQRRLTDQVMNYLSFRPRSEKEILDYLTKAISKNEKIKWSQAKQSPLPELVIAKLKKYDLVNDKEFAKWWIDSRTRAKQKSRAIIQAELIQKGISKEQVELLLPKNKQSDLKLALKVIEKKRKTLERLSPQESRKKIYSWLGSRGFDFEIASDVFAIYSKKR